MSSSRHRGSNGSRSSRSGGGGYWDVVMPQQGSSSRGSVPGLSSFPGPHLPPLHPSPGQGQWPAPPPSYPMPGYPGPSPARSFSSGSYGPVPGAGYPLNPLPPPTALRGHLAPGPYPLPLPPTGSYGVTGRAPLAPPCVPPPLLPPPGSEKKSGARRGPGSSSGSSSTKKFPCQFCRQSFTRKGHLKDHVTAVHEKRKPYACDKEKCGAAFGFQSSLQRHTKHVHDKKKRKK